MNVKLKMNINTKNFTAMKKKLFFAAFALALFASCSDNDYVGDQASLNAVTGSGAIAFSSNTPGITRATQEDAAAATALGNKFIVWGEKNESGGTAATDANKVFHNYTVEYTASTANTTLSNTNDWEYVGKTSYGTKLTPNAPTSQTIKYWDNGANSYTFTALSALDTDITNDRVVITKNTSGATAFDKGYTIAVKADASVGNIFFADRINDAPANLRNSAVKFSFRNLQAKLRFGIYEHVQGYTVKIKQVKYNNAYSTEHFGVDGKFIKPGESTSFTVTYGDGTTGPLNKALVAVSGSSSTDTYLASTSTTIMTTAAIGTSSSGATEDDYVSILPYTSNTTDLSFTIDYTLKSEDTNEIIEITGKTVKVPAAYCQWKSNYAYTYLFKITDSDLTPITFDACYVEDENGNQETITTVTEPSITTFGVVLDNTDKFKNYVTGKDEYQLPGGSDKLDIYATIMDGTSVLTPQLTEATKANFVKVYAVKYKDGATDDQKTAHPITELSVANAIEHPGGLITATHINSAANDYFATAPAAVTTVPGEDGNNKSVNALKLTGVKAAGKYAVEIVTYTAVTLTSGADLNGYYSVDGNGIYSKQTSGTADGSSTYYKQVKTYKVINVVAAP